MKVIRNKATIKGVEVEMLFTPRLFEFKTPSMKFNNGETSGQVAGMYADIAYCAALNLWTLRDRDVADFKLERADFHEWAMSDPTEFGKTMRIALEALTNKTLEELLKEKEDSDKKDASEEVKKKSSSSITKKLKNFWLAIVECLKSKQPGHR